MSISKLKTKADKAFRQRLLSEAIRNSEDRIQCYITGNWFEEDGLHVCHYVRRSNNKYRYSLNNCKLCCIYTNTIEDQIPTIHESASGRKLSLHEYKFREKLIEELGEQEIIRMEKDKEIMKLFKNDYMNIINYEKENK